jgi:Tol biopolymer transport system component
MSQSLKEWRTMASYAARICLLKSYIALITLSNLLYVGCKHDTSSQAELPRGIFVDKIAFTSWHLSQGLPPMLTVADMYDDGGTFRLYNRKELQEGIAPSISRDRTWIAYVLVRNGLHPMRTNVDGSQMRQLPFPDTLFVQGVSISPKGTEIAICYQRSDNLEEIYLGLVSSDGGIVTTLSDTPGRVLSPNWTPDGQRIFFGWIDLYNTYGHSPPSSFLKGYIRSVLRDGTNLVTISDTASAISNDVDPCVSPDGTQLVFVSMRNYPDNYFPEVFLMTVNGRNIRQLTHCIGCVRHGDHFDNYTYDNNPFWTKDGLHIVFQRITYTYDHDAGRYKPEVRDLYVMSSDGTGLQNLTNDGISTLVKP